MRQHFPLTLTLALTLPQVRYFSANSKNGINDSGLLHRLATGGFGEFDSLEDAFDRHLQFFPVQRLRYFRNLEDAIWRSSRGDNSASDSFANWIW